MAEPDVAASPEARACRVLCLGLRAEARSDLDRATSLYGHVASSADGAVSPELLRAALRRGGAVELLRGEPGRAASYLRRQLALSAALPAPSRAFAEQRLSDALVAGGRLDEARAVLASSRVPLAELPRLDRLLRASALLRLGLAPDPDLLTELAGADEVPIENVVPVLVDAVWEREIGDAPRLYDALAQAVGRAPDCRVASVAGKRLARCADRFERAGRCGDAAACWRLLWIQRRERRGADHPRTLAALDRFTRLSARAGSPPQRIGARLSGWLRAARRDVSGRRSRR